MSGVSRDLFNKIVAIICTVVFLLGIGGFLGYTFYTDSIEEQELERIKGLSMSLEIKKEQYKRELNNLERDMLDSLPAGSTMTMVVTSVKSELYTKLYPLFNATHELCVPETDPALVGTMCLSPTSLPGDDGCITMDEYRELMDAGWTTAIYVSNKDVADLEAYISNLQSILADRGIALPKVAYFEKRTYTPNYDGILVRHGIEGIFHHEENGFDLICQDTESVIWRVGSVDWNTKIISLALLDSILNTPGSTSFTISFDKDEPNSYFYGDPMANGSIDRMLDKIREHIVKGNINVRDILVGREIYSNFLAEYNAKAPFIQEKKDELNRLIDEIEIRLMKIYSGDFTEED